MGIFGVSSIKVEMLRWLLLSLTVKSKFLKVATAGHMRPGPTTSLAPLSVHSPSITLLSHSGLLAAPGPQQAGPLHFLCLCLKCPQIAT